MRQQRENIERLNGAGEQIAARIDSIYAMHFHVDIQLRRLRCIEMEYINFKVLENSISIQIDAFRPNK